MAAFHISLFYHSFDAADKQRIHEYFISLCLTVIPTTKVDRPKWSQGSPNMTPTIAFFLTNYVINV